MRSCASGVVASSVPVRPVMLSVRPAEPVSPTVRVPAGVAGAEVRSGRVGSVQCRLTALAGSPWLTSDRTMDAGMRSADGAGARPGQVDRAADPVPVGDRHGKAVLRRFGPPWNSEPSKGGDVVAGCGSAQTNMIECHVGDREVRACGGSRSCRAVQAVPTAAAVASALSGRCWSGRADWRTSIDRSSGAGRAR